MLLSRALGIRWDVSHDAFFYVSDYANISHASNVTRQQGLVQVSSMYDLLGLIAPVVFFLRQNDFSGDIMTETWLGWIVTILVASDVG